MSPIEVMIKRYFVSYDRG